MSQEAFRGGAKTLTDIRSFALALMRCLPVDLANVITIPRLYALHLLSNQDGRPGPKGAIVMPTLRRLSAESIDRQGIFLLDNGLALFLFVGSAAPPNLVQALFNVPSADRIPAGKVF